MENNSYELCVQFIHFEIPLQQKIDQRIHLIVKKGIKSVMLVFFLLCIFSDHTRRHAMMQKFMT